MAKFYYEHPDLIREGIIFGAKRPEPEPVKPVPVPVELEPDEPAPVITGRTCQHCGSPLRTTKQKKYCSDACRYGAELERGKKRRRAELVGVTRTCAYCGKEYPATLGNSKYCSHECYRARNEEQAKLKRGSSAKIKTKNCAICGKEFTTFYPSKLTCSGDCAHEWKLRYDREKHRKAKQKKEAANG